jgi:hypothetical protein
MIRFSDEWVEHEIKKIEADFAEQKSKLLRLQARAKLLDLERAELLQQLGDMKKKLQKIKDNETKK